MASMARPTHLSAHAFAVLAVLLMTNLASAQWMRGRARLFIADNTPASPAVVVVDIPSYNVSQRIQMPGTTLQLGVSHDDAHVGVFRNRDNDQQFFTVISTGIRGLVPAAGPRGAVPAPLKEGEVGPMRAAVLTKSFLLVNGSDGIGGVEGGRELVFHDRWRVYYAYAESHGRVYAYRSEHLHGSNLFRPTVTMQLPVGHFHVLPYGDHLIAPHTGVHAAFVLDRQGRTLRRFPCGACHGAATYVPSNQARMASVFGCNDTVLVVAGTSARATYLNTTGMGPRVGSFINGAPGVFWSSTATQRFFYRTDVRGAVPTISNNITHRGGALRLLSLPRHGQFLGLHNDGNLVIYDGESGAVLASLLLREGGFPANQTSPFIQSDVAETTFFVAVPAAGAVHIISVDQGHDEADHDDDHAASTPSASGGNATRSASGAAAPADEHAGHGHSLRRALLQQVGGVNSTGVVSMKLERVVAVGGMPTSMTLAYMPGVAPAHDE